MKNAFSSCALSGRFDIPASDYIRQDLFKSFTCTFDVFPGRVFPLELVDVTRKANLNQLYHMRLRLKPVKGVDIAAGMSVNVTIDYNPRGEVLMGIRELFSFLPSNNMEDAPSVPTSDDIHREDERLDTIIPADPNVPYDVKEIIDLHGWRDVLSAS